VVVDADQQRVVGYHALAAAVVSPAKATSRVRGGQPRYPIPAVLLARLAVDVSVQGRGVGAFLDLALQRRIQPHGVHYGAEGQRFESSRARFEEGGIAVARRCFSSKGEVSRRSSRLPDTPVS
jgi:GNAT superfamily N-acetyltransferase